MLGVVPNRRKTAKSVLAHTAWNLLILSPFTIAFWILTEKIHTESTETYFTRNVETNRDNYTETYRYTDRTCNGIPWDVANFARWAFLGCCIYQLATLPLNMFAMKRSHKIGRESKLTHWLQATDVLHWVFNWALFWYLVTALANRSQCSDGRMRGLLWATVFISVALAVVGLILGLIALAKFITRMLKEIREEATLRAHEGVDVIVAKGGVTQPMRQGGVEIMEVRKTNVVEDRNRVRPLDHIVDKGETRHIDNGIGAGELKKEEVIIQRREEVARDRSDPRYMVRDERLDMGDNLPVNTNNVRTHDIHASQPRKF